jgi:DNA-binding NarL/FixJ family response regulator
MALIRVAIIEDDQGFAEALERILNGTPGFRCAGTFGDAESALQKLALADVEVVLTDLSLPGINGTECIRRFRRNSNQALFLVLTVHEDVDRIVESLRAGATGYVLKKTPPAEILEAIAEMAAGGAPMSPAIARKVAQYFHGAPPIGNQLSDLSDRELEILHSISTGRSDKEIGRQLSISAHTVGNHIRSIYSKLHVRSRVEAAAKYLGRP